jgi:hypothetical protein
MRREIVRKHYGKNDKQQGNCITENRIVDAQRRALKAKRIKAAK